MAAYLGLEQDRCCRLTVSLIDLQLKEPNSIKFQFSNTVEQILN